MVSRPSVRNSTAMLAMLSFPDIFDASGGARKRKACVSYLFPLFTAKMVGTDQILNDVLHWLFCCPLTSDNIERRREPSR
jgi:hypothetical protein